MKTVFSYITFVMLTIASGCGQAQNCAMQKHAEDTLFEFYSNHFRTWENAPGDGPANELFEKLDSLLEKYCTPRLRNEAMEAFENVGADVLTNNLGSVDLNENLKVVHHSSDEYVVTFDATYSNVPGGTLKKTILLYVKVVKEGDIYKIDSVR